LCEQLSPGRLCGSIGAVNLRMGIERTIRQTLYSLIVSSYNMVTRCVVRSFVANVDDVENCQRSFTSGMFQGSSPDHVILSMA